MPDRATMAPTPGERSDLRGQRAQYPDRDRTAIGARPPIGKAGQLGGIGLAGNQRLDHCAAALAHQIGKS
jgi:hypothetical protein